MPENFLNRRHLIRTIERKGLIGSKGGIKNNMLIIGLLPSDKVLRTRISQRGDKIFRSGVIEETKELLSKYGEDSLIKTAGIVYRISLEIVKGKTSMQEGIGQFKYADWQYARRQRTWFKRNKFINWHESSEQAYKEIARILNN
jgi:tRNA dimethylallyltransferase